MSKKYARKKTTVVCLFSSTFFFIFAFVYSIKYKKFKTKFYRVKFCRTFPKESTAETSNVECAHSTLRVFSCSRIGACY